MYNKTLILISTLVLLNLSSCKDETVSPQASNNNNNDEPVEEFLTWQTDGKEVIHISSSEFFKKWEDQPGVGTDSTLMCDLGDIDGVPFNRLLLWYDINTTFGYSLHTGEFLPDMWPGNARFDPDSLETFGFFTYGNWSGKLSMNGDRNEPYDHCRIIKRNGKFVIDFKGVRLVHTSPDIKGTIDGYIVWEITEK